MPKKKTTWDRRTKAIGFRLTEAEYALLDERSGTAQSVHGYARSRTLENRRLPRSRLVQLTTAASQIYEAELRIQRNVEQGNIRFASDHHRTEFETLLSAIGDAREALMHSMIEEFEDGPNPR